MVLYTCNCCEKCFKQEKYYIKHQNNKKKCKKQSQSRAKESQKRAKESQNIIKKNVYMCNICNKIFIFKNSLYKHIKYNRCKVNEGNNNNNNKEKIKKNHDKKSELDDNIPKYSKNIPKYSKNIPKYSKNIPKYSKNIPKYSKNIPKYCKNIENFCNYCKKNYNSKSALNKHIKKNCKIKKQYYIEKNELLNKMIKDMDQMKKKIKKMENNKKNNIINNNTQYNLINNIKMVNFGEENYDNIPKKENIRIIDKGYLSIQELVKYMHFNKNILEQQNIYISNLRDKYALVYKDNNWQVLNRNETIEYLTIDKRDYIINKYEEIKGELNKKITKKFNNFYENNDNKKILNEIKEEIIMLLYNNNSISIDTRKNISNL
jgi:hypothetical protein